MSPIFGSHLGLIAARIRLPMRRACDLSSPWLLDVRRELAFHLQSWLIAAEKSRSRQ